MNPDGDGDEELPMPAFEGMVCPNPSIQIKSFFNQSQICLINSNGFRSHFVDSIFFLQIDDKELSMPAFEGVVSSNLRK